ncbi:hypothetical protein Hanom_Chr05g00434871 [Helianthus anomalus]
MQSNSWWSPSSEEEELFYANAVLRVAKIIMEEEEEEVSSETQTRQQRINRDHHGLSLIKFLSLFLLSSYLYFFYERRAREISERLFFRCTLLQC